MLAAIIAWIQVGCIEHFENRGSPEPMPPSTATRTIPAGERARSTEPVTCEEAEAMVDRALEHRDEVTLANATSSRDRLCSGPR
jgi:hypothetical protein